MPKIQVVSRETLVVHERLTHTNSLLVKDSRKNEKERHLIGHLDGAIREWHLPTPVSAGMF